VATSKRHKEPAAQPEDEGERMPFDDALRQILKAKPVHKPAKKREPKKNHA
jgi:hypothetical protein